MLDRLRVLVQNRKATIELPEEEKSSGPERSPAVSSSSFPNHGEHKIFHGTPSVTQESKVQSKTSSRLWGFSFTKVNKDDSVCNGENVRTLWDCCRSYKIDHMNYKPQERKLPPLPMQPQIPPLSIRLEAQNRGAHQSRLLSIITTDSIAGSETGGISPLWQWRMSDPSLTTQDLEALGRRTRRPRRKKGPSSERASTLDSATRSIPSLCSEKSLLDVEIIMNIMEYVVTGEKVFNNTEENVSFLRAISASCAAALKSGKDTLELPYTKTDLVEALVMVMETLPELSVPSGTLAYSMVTAYNLSKIKPPLNSELESCILRLALHGILSMEIDLEDSHTQALFKSCSDTMEILLKGLLSENPTTSHLLFILHHINFWIHSRNVHERARAMQCSTVLLQYAVQLPDFDNTGEIPALGHQVAQFGICITDPLENVSLQAREAIKYLYQLHMGLGTENIGELWCQEPGDKKLQAYMDICRVGELFRKSFTEDQKRTFLQTSFLSLYDPLRRQCEAGILLVYSLQEKASELMGDEATDMERKIYHQLFLLRTLRQVPEALQSIIPRTVDNN